MFRIYANGTLIYNPRADSDQILSAKLVRELNSAANFTFTPSPSNTPALDLPKLKTYIEVFDEEVSIFRGRILNPRVDLHNVITYTCEGELAFLNDSIVRTYTFRANDPNGYLRILINNHNAQVDLEKHFVVRRVTVFDRDRDGARVAGSARYIKTLEAIQENLIDVFGGVLYLERIDGVTYLDYLTESPNTSTQPIHLEHNLIDLDYFNRGENIATAIIPLGDRLVDDAGYETDERLSIDSVNGGSDFVFDQAAVEQFGWIFRAVEFDDITDPAELLELGRGALAKAIHPIESIEVRAFDLSRIDDFYERIRFLDYVTVESPVNGISARLLVAKMTNDLLDASQDVLVLGSEFGTFTRTLAQNRQQLSSVRNGAVTADQVRRAINNANTGMVNVNRVPELPASRIGSGVLDPARIPTLPISRVSDLQNQLNQRLPLTGGSLTGDLTRGSVRLTATAIGTHNNTNFIIARQGVNQMNFRANDILVQRPVNFSSQNLTAINQINANVMNEAGHRVVTRSRQIPAHANLNAAAWRVEGRYHNPLNYQAQTIANRPLGMNAAFSMSVYRHSANHVEGCHQVIRQFDNNRVFIRSMAVNNGWTPWREFVTAPV